MQISLPATLLVSFFCEKQKSFADTLRKSVSVALFITLDLLHKQSKPSKNEKANRIFYPYFYLFADNRTNSCKT
ncbi:MAG TPA: hypothetical protein VJI69_00415, partial [Bacteroidia bacterium]|nr:hypothetical protein [Bacteroidia bacterium]